MKYFRYARRLLLVLKIEVLFKGVFGVWFAIGCFISSPKKEAYFIEEKLVTPHQV
jgi:hypothetical protein